MNGFILLLKRGLVLEINDGVYITFLDLYGLFYFYFFFEIKFNVEIKI